MIQFLTNDSASAIILGQRGRVGASFELTPSQKPLTEGNRWLDSITGLGSIDSIPWVKHYEEKTVAKDLQNIQQACGMRLTPDIKYAW